MANLFSFFQGPRAHGWPSCCFKRRPCTPCQREQPWQLGGRESSIAGLTSGLYAYVSPICTFRTCKWSIRGIGILQHEKTTTWRGRCLLWQVPRCILAYIPLPRHFTRSGGCKATFPSVRWGGFARGGGVSIGWGGSVATVEGFGASGRAGLPLWPCGFFGEGSEESWRPRGDNVIHHGAYFVAFVCFSWTVCWFSRSCDDFLFWFF